GGDIKPGLTQCAPNENPLVTGCAVVAPQFQSGRPVSYSTALENLVTSTALDKGVGLQLNIPLRNRAAQAVQIRSELEYRQAEMRLQQIENQISIQVRNPQFGVKQNRASVASAQAAVDYAKQSLDAEQK